MNQEILESLGLSPNEAKMYESLVERGELSVSDIALSAGVHRRNAYDAIQRLIAKGLCFQIVSTGENLYNAVDPEKLTELLAEKQEQLARILPELKKKFTHRTASEEAYIYKGLEGEIRKIVNYVNLFGYNLSTALRNVAATTASQELKELLARKQALRKALADLGG